MTSNPQIHWHNLLDTNNLKVFAKTDNNLYAKNRHKAIETNGYRRLPCNAI